MFDFIHNNKRIVQVVLGLITLPFAFWGIESYQRLSSTVGEVASVGGQKITEAEFNEELRQQQDRMRSLLGRNFDPAMFESPELRAQLLEGMISQRLLTERAVRSGMYVTDDQLREVIASIPGFQVNGRFSPQLYEDTLRREGYAPATFEMSLRRDLMLQQLSAAVADSGIVSRAAARQAANLRAERREVSEFLVPSAQFNSQVKVTPEQVRTYYESNRGRFQVPEQARVEYLVLNSDALQARESVSADEVKAWYDSHLDQYQLKEQRQASHILIAVKQNASSAERATGKAKGEQILAQVRKSPASFAELAKKNSDDPGSASKGGDVGYFSRGMMVKAFDDVVFRLKLNETSDLVESDFGYHIVRLTGIKPGKTRSLEEARPEIERELKKQRAGRKFAESAESFSNLVYEQSDSLKPTAEKFGLTIQNSGWITRDSAQAAALQNAKLLAAIFGDDAVKNRRNTEAIETSPGNVVSAHVIEHKPAAVRALDEVRGDIVKELTHQETLALARKQALGLIDKLKKGGEGAVRFSGTKTISREDPQGVKPQGLAAAFRADRSKLPSYVGFEQPDGYVILRLSRVLEPTLDDAKEKNLQVELARAEGSLEFQAFVASLRANEDVRIRKDALQKK